jgi:SprT protein
MLIELNMTLFRENPEYFLNHTIPHEIAHLVQFNKFDLKGVSTPGHGVHWKETMRIMGKVPHEKHTLDTTNAVVAYKRHKMQKAADKKAAARKQKNDAS